MGYSALARVMTGWTGTIVCDGITVTPGTRESVCSLLIRMVRDVLVYSGRTLTLSISDTGVITVASDSSFDFTPSSGVATATGFTAGPYSGASSYTAASAYDTAYVPARGLRLEGPFVATTRGSVVADGSGAASPRRVSRSSPLVMWDSQLQLPSFEGFDWDVWHGNRWFGRFVVERVQRTAMGSLRTVNNVRFDLDVREVYAGEVVQTAPDWTKMPVAQAWLLGYVRTDVDGYRNIEIEGTPYSPASSGTGGYRFDAYLDEINTVIAAYPSTLTWETSGRVQGDGLVIVCDRLGWVIGHGAEASALFFGDVSAFVPPAGIPLMGATWEHVETDADRRLILDESLRNQGYAWGAAQLWRCKLVMHRYALEALQTGWCLNGRVCLAAANKLSTPFSLSDPTGYIDGYVVGDPVVSWRDPQQETAVVEMTIATE